MNYLTYFLAPIIAYLGLLLGIILIKLAPEEQKPGKKYFILLKKILFFLIIAFLLFSYRINYIFSAILLLFIIILMSTGKLNLSKSIIVYILFGFTLYFSYKIPDLFIIESILVFLYGIPNASLMLKKNNYYDILVKNLWFFAPIIIPPLLSI